MEPPYRVGMNSLVIVHTNIARHVLGGSLVFTNNDELFTYRQYIPYTLCYGKVVSNLISIYK